MGRGLTDVSKQCFQKYVQVHKPLAQEVWRHGSKGGILHTLCHINLCWAMFVACHLQCASSRKRGVDNVDCVRDVTSLIWSNQYGPHIRRTSMALRHTNHWHHVMCDVMSHDMCNILQRPYVTRVTYMSYTVSLIRHFKSCTSEVETPLPVCWKPERFSSSVTVAALLYQWYSQCKMLPIVVTVLCNTGLSISLRFLTSYYEYGSNRLTAIASRKH